MLLVSSTEAAAVQCCCQQDLAKFIKVLEYHAGDAAPPAVPVGNICFVLAAEDVLAGCLDLFPAPHRHLPDYGAWTLLSILQVVGRLWIARLKGFVHAPLQGFPIACKSVTGQLKTFRQHL